MGVVGPVRSEGEGIGRRVVGRPLRFASLALCLGVTLAMCTTPSSRAQESSGRAGGNRVQKLHVGAAQPAAPRVSSSLEVVLTIKGHGPRTVSMPRRVVDSRNVSLVYTCTVALSTDMSGSQASPEAFPLRFNSPKGVLGGAGCGRGTTFGLSFSSRVAVHRYLPLTKLVIDAAPDVSYWIDVAVGKSS